MKDVFLINKDFGLVMEPESFPADGIQMDESSAPIKIDWVIINIITKGTGRGVIDGKEFVVKERDMFMLLPNTVIESRQKSEDMCVKCLCISRTYIEKIISYSVFNWDVWSLLRTSPVLSLTDDEYERFVLYYKLICSKMENKEQPCYNESVQALMKALMFDFYAVIGRYIAPKKDYSQGGSLFRDFLHLMAETYPRPRNVTYYSDQLNVTSKYLSAVCKQYSGNTASALINKAVSRDIHDLLTESNKSIKEIMAELDFPSQSFFGRYVKKHLGMGPKEYRASQLS